MESAITSKKGLKMASNFGNNRSPVFWRRAINNARDTGHEPSLSGTCMEEVS